jgi:ATP-dependent helicase HrpB
VIPLPIDPHIEAIRASLERGRAAVVIAEPGAGKTTRVPPSLLDAGALVLLQPRRVAARAIAERIAHEQGWQVGREIGWQIRFERRSSRDTRLLVVTEGILTAKLQRDPLLSEFHTVVLDEFHERGLHGDLAIALAKQAWRARPDLRLVVMSATLDAEPVARFLEGCPVHHIAGRRYPLEIAYAPATPLVECAESLARTVDGDVLCFLPGAAEIRAAVSDLRTRLRVPEFEVLPLYGGLSADEQDHALRPGGGAPRRIVVATNIAETSITVPGVRAVVDTGLHKVARYDADRAIDSLITERIPQDSADQRAGRAGREASGRAIRLWDPIDRLRPHRDAEIHRIDLSSAVLDVLAWGGHPSQLDWFERPRQESIDMALRLLARLDAVRDGRLSELGRLMQRLPLHPRLARMLIAVNGAWPLVQACALLSERQYVRVRSQTTTSDLLSAIDDWDAAAPHVKQAARDVRRTVERSLGPSAETIRDEDFRRAILAGYPDRVARRRAPASLRVKLSSGTGAVLGRESGVVEGEFLVAVDVQAVETVATTAGRRPGRATSPHVDADADSRIRIASRIERDWLEPNARRIERWFDSNTQEVRAALVESYDALVLIERPVPIEDDRAADLLAEAWLDREPPETDAQLIRRLRFTGHSIDLADLVRAAAYGVRSLSQVHLARALEPAVRHALDRDAPERLEVPSGRTVPLFYQGDGTITASVKLQELFGLAETPTVGSRRQPVVLSLLAPNGQPVQVTSDLRSFWERTYLEVRKELRGRYPKHPWPDNPWTAEPTARTKRRAT